MFPLVSLAILGGMPLDPNSSEPPYKQLAALLAGRIRAGRYAPGSALPSGAELAAEAGVSRVTVQNALKILKSDGLVVGRQGSGVFVRTDESSGANSIRVALERASLVAEEGVGLIFYGHTVEDLVEWLPAVADLLADRDDMQIRIIEPASQIYSDLREVNAPHQGPGAGHRAALVADTLKALTLRYASVELIGARVLPGVRWVAAEGLESANANNPDNGLVRWFEQEWQALSLCEEHEFGERLKVDLHSVERTPTPISAT